MRKISYMLVGVMLVSVLSLCGCGSKENTEDTTTKVATEATTEDATEATTKEAETEETTVDDGLVEYKVTVVDDAGNPVANAMVQCCKDSCVPAMTNADGVAEFKLAEDDYDVKFAAFPEGYEYMSDEEVFNFEDGKYELTITIKKK